MEYRIDSCSIKLVEKNNISKLLILFRDNLVKDFSRLLWQ